jgi:hypothetical protein
LSVQAFFKEQKAPVCTTALSHGVAAVPRSNELNKKETDENAQQYWTSLNAN